MTKRAFHLSVNYTTNSSGHRIGISPSQGEDLGRELAQLADRMLENASTHPITYFHDRIATLYELAADAYRLGASASLGHGRALRYESESRRCLEQAAKVRDALEKSDA